MMSNDQIRCVTNISNADFSCSNTQVSVIDAQTFQGVLWLNVTVMDFHLVITCLSPISVTHGIKNSIQPKLLLCSRNYPIFHVGTSVS